MEHENEYGQKYLSVIIQQNPDINRGFAFVEFENHTQASVARRQFHPRNLMIWDQILHVDWADPLPDIDPLELAQVLRNGFFNGELLI